MSKHNKSSEVIIQELQANVNNMVTLILLEGTVVLCKIVKYDDITKILTIKTSKSYLRRTGRGGYINNDRQESDLNIHQVRSVMPSQS
ncbi:MAG: hypothetical protein AAB614_01615 [Patescibacteria group bacterium]